MKLFPFLALIILNGFALFNPNTFNLSEEDSLPLFSMKDQGATISLGKNAQNMVQRQNFPRDCSTDFWTITADGHIQQWSLKNRTVSGGDTILSGGGTCLSFCGDNTSPTFFSNDYNPLGIIYYEPDSGWIHIPTSDAIDNNGGHQQHQYYRVEGAVIQIVKYWDGANLLSIDSLRGEFFVGVQDIGVDTLGQAWIFTGGNLGEVDSLKVYNQTGKINSYAIQFKDIAYGSFFLNDTLYIGTTQDSIYPIVVGDSTAELGQAIPFPASNFTDMASCQDEESTTSILDYPIQPLKMFPNPSHGHLILPFELEKANISIYNSQGQIITFTLRGRELDIHEHPAGIYFIRIISKDRAGIQKIIKL